MPCVLVSARAAAHTRIIRDTDPANIATSVPATAVAHTSPTVVGTGPGKTSGSGGGGGQADLSEKNEQGHYIRNKKGLELCRGYGHCTCKGGNAGRCPSNDSRTHQCYICLQQHAGSDHDKLQKGAGGKGKGGGKGKAKGGGRRR